MKDRDLGQVKKSVDSLHTGSEKLKVKLFYFSSCAKLQRPEEYDFILNPRQTDIQIEPMPYLNYYNSWTPLQQWVKYRYLFVSLCYFYMCELSVGQCWSDHGGCDTGRRDSAVPSSLSFHLAGEQAKDGQWLINWNSHAWKGA